MTKPDDIPNKPPITFFVNGEPETTDQSELTVTAILQLAGFTPATDYVLASENPPRTYADYGETVKLHQHQRFTAQFNGQTPVS